RGQAASQAAPEEVQASYKASGTVAFGQGPQVQRQITQQGRLPEPIPDGGLVQARRPPPGNIAPQRRVQPLPEALWLDVVVKFVCLLQPLLRLRRQVSAWVK